MYAAIRTSQRLLFFLSLLFYLLFFSGSFYTSDEVLMALVTRNVVERQKFTFEETYGQTSTGYGIGQPLCGIPAYGIDRFLERLFHYRETLDITLLTITNAIVTAFLVVFVFNFVLLMTQNLAAAHATAGLFAITTLFLPYSKTFLSEPLSALCFFASFHYLVCYVKGRDRSFLLWSALVFAYGVLTRFSAILFLPLYVAYLAASLFAADRKLEKEHVGAALAFLFPSLVAIGINLCLNLFLRGSLMRTAYEGSDFTTSIWVGAYGLLLSVGRGLFVYNPILLVALCFFPLFYRENRREALFTIVFFVASLYLYGKFWTWHAGWTLGSRFLLPVIPFLFLPIYYAFSGRIKLSAAPKIAIAVFALTSLVVQVGNCLVKPTDYNNEIWGFLSGENEFLFIPQASAFTGNLALIADGDIDLIWARLWKAHYLVPCLSTFGALFAAFLILLAIWLRRLGVTAATIVRGWQRVDQWTRRNRIAVVSVMMVVLVFVAAFIGRGLRGLYRDSMTESTSHRALDRRLRLKVEQSGASREWTWQGYLEAPITGSYTFYLKVNGEYDVKIGSTVLFANRNKIPQHLPRGKIELQKGFHPIAIWYRTYPESDGIFNVYWALPGGGVYIQPISGEYLYPVLPGRFEKVSNALFRYYWLLLLFVFLPPLLFYQVARSPVCKKESNDEQGSEKRLPQDPL
jgi:hypothetical protein